MIKVLSLTALMVMSAVAQAESCKDHMIDESWPQDRLESLYSCKRIQTVVGNPDYGYDRLCFGTLKTQYSQYQDTWYKTYRYNENDFGGYSTIVVQNSSGHVKDGSVQQKGDQQIIRSTDHTSGTTGEKWIEETVFNLKTQTDLSFNTYKKSYFSQKLSGSDIYRCDREL